MEREKVLVSAEETARQKEYMDKVRALHEQRTTKPLAYVHTYGCQQNVADQRERRAGAAVVHLAHLARKFLLTRELLLADDDFFAFQGMFPPESR